MRKQIAVLCRKRLDLTNREIGARFSKTAQYVGSLCQARRINRDSLRRKPVCLHSKAASGG
jgi:hypothetical protein